MARTGLMVCMILLSPSAAHGETVESELTPGPACNPELTNPPQFCPGGERCPVDGQCPDYVSCNPQLNPPQLCASGDRCPPSGFCLNPVPTPTPAPSMPAPAPAPSPGPVCNPELTNPPQFCPGGERCPVDGQCPDYFSCNPQWNPPQLCASGDKCPPSGFCLNPVPTPTPATPAPAPAPTPSPGTLCRLEVSLIPSGDRSGPVEEIYWAETVCKNVEYRNIASGEQGVKENVWIQLDPVTVPFCNMVTFTGFEFFSDSACTQSKGRSVVFTDGDTIFNGCRDHTGELVPGAACRGGIFPVFRV